MEPKTILERLAMIYLAGRVGEVRALRGGSQGWKRHRTSQELTAHHESSHAVLIAAFTYTVYMASITPKPLESSAGRVLFGVKPNADGAVKPGPSDNKGAVQLCWALSGAKGWRETLREVRRLRALTALA